MSKYSGQIPAYRLHKPSGQARVILAGKHIYLGLYGSPESQEKYARLIAERAAAPTEASFAPLGPLAIDFSIDELILAYLRFAETYYIENGKPTKELTCMKEALRPLRKLYANTPAGRFGPKALQAVRQDLVDQGLSRGVVNHRIGRIKRVFKWGVAEELLPPAIHHGLQAVGGLRFGRSGARETQPIKPVPDAWVEAVLPFVSSQVGAMIQLQRLTGMRPCEVVQLRMADVDVSNDVWIFELSKHKNRWRGHRRQIPLGPKAQEIIKGFMSLSTEGYLFSPLQAELARSDARRRARATPMTPSQAKRRRKRRCRRAKRDHYDVDSYRRAITYGIKKAGLAEVKIPHWHPNQLRHSRATELRKLHGIEAAQVSLGHARADVTEVYAERNLELAVRLALQTG